MKLYCNDDFVGDTPLTYAVRSKKNVDAVRYLLDHDADPNKRVHHGCTPLSIAVGKGTTYHAYTSHCSYVLYVVMSLLINNFVLINKFLLKGSRNVLHNLLDIHHGYQNRECMSYMSHLIRIYLVLLVPIFSERERDSHK